ncbi:MAG: antibiotic biosynthesis monooxygenase [Silicimonas sp.]|nr:antibiotic biosynthesis monooxygenase [Silicimonas sp.]
MIAVCVTFDIKPEHLKAFLPLMHAQATNSLAQEPGCRHFDVCTDGDNKDRVFLYELYSDRAAFDAHLASDHFKTFDVSVVGMIAAKKVSIFDTVTSGA